MNVTALAFPPATFDAVMANSVLQFGGPRSLGERARVTRPGGRIACSLPWGPAEGTELCLHHVDEAAEPDRSTARQRLAAARVRPDAERVAQRFPPDALGAFRDEFTTRVATGGGAGLRGEFLYWCFTLPG